MVGAEWKLVGVWKIEAGNEGYSKGIRERRILISRLFDSIESYMRKNYRKGVEKYIVVVIRY